MSFALTRSHLLVVVLGVAVATAGCDRQEASQEPPEPPPAPTLPDGRHFLADKPLKLISKEKSERLKLAEEIENAERRADGYKNLIRNPAFDLSLQAQPTAKDPIPLAKATRGVKGKGPLKATIETSLGSFTCTLDEKASPVALAHFVALARGINLWWNGRTRDWSNAPFYENRFVYKVQRGEAIHLGLPPQAGDARLENPMVLPVDILSETHSIKAYDIAVLRANKLAPLHTNFIVAATDKPSLKEVTYPIGSCEPYDVIQKIAGVRTTPEMIPLQEITVKNVTISR